MDRIEAELLIPGEGAPIRDGVVLLDGPRISYAGPAALAPSSPGACVVSVTTVMPGMWDCHGHLIGARSMDLNLVALEPAAVRAAPRSTRGSPRSARWAGSASTWPGSSPRASWTAR